jgi:S1-C subfamily serine protease
MRCQLLSICCLLAAAAFARAQDAIPAKTLAEIKNATVFVKVAMGDKSATGSGFVMRVDGDTGYVVTNHHVVVVPRGNDPRVTVVFRSGTKNEQSVAAEVLASDPDKDLAVLRVKGVKEPTAIDLGQKPEVTETLPVYILGFPFGDDLDRIFKGKGNPSITVGKGSVSSIRESRDGEIAAVQIDGNLNPGNSGGPVVNSKGQLVGVAVARVGQGIGLAIPPQHLDQMLEGRVADCAVKATVQDNKAKVSVEVRLIDPLEKIKAVTVHFVHSEPGKAAPKPANGGLAAAAGANKVELKVEKQLARGEFTIVAKEPGLVHCACQASVVNGAGRTVAGDIVDSFVSIVPGAVSDKLIYFEQAKHQANVSCAQFAPDGKTLASADYYGVIMLWDVDKGWATTPLKGHTKEVKALAFAPDGKLLASSGSSTDDTIRVWDVAAGKELRQWKLPNETGHDPRGIPLAFAPNGRLLAVGGMDNDVTFYDPGNGDKIGAIKPPCDEKDNYIYPVESLAFSADAKTLAVGAGRSIRLWDTAQRKEIRLLPQQKGGILALAWTTDGKTLAFSTTDGALVLWDVTDNKERANLTGNWGVVRFLAFASRGDMLLTSSTDDNLRVWHVASGKEVANYRWHNTQNLTCGSLSPDDRKVAAGTTSGVVAVLNFDKLREQKSDKK